MSNKHPQRTPFSTGDAIALSSPSGRMSKRARRAAEKRLELALFGPGGLREAIRPRPLSATPPAELMRRQAKRLRDLAARGMSVRKFTKEADRLEREAEGLEKP